MRPSHLYSLAHGVCICAIVIACGAVHNHAANVGMEDLNEGWHNKAFESHPLSLLDVKVAFYNGRRSASVQFEAGDKQLQYELESFSVYSEGASIATYSDAGVKYLSTGESRSFRSRQSGKWASATFHDDGSISGLFEDDTNLLEISPASNLPKDVAVTTLLEEQGGKTPLHFIQYRSSADMLLPGNSILARGAAVNTSMSESDDTDLEIAIDEPFTDASGHHDVFQIPEGADSPLDYSTSADNWKGVKWWPGCYKGDDKLHKVVIEAIGDTEAYYVERGEAGLKRKIESIIAQSSFIYEKQMNIRLELGSLKMYKTKQSGRPRPPRQRRPRFFQAAQAPIPSYALGCPGSNDRVFMSSKLQGLRTRTETNPYAATHLFTGCGNGNGATGVAYIRGLCNGRSNKGVVQLKAQLGAWLVFAHELGHTFGGRHTFEEGVGKTGGLMDYGNGKTNDGVYQFNTRYRKAEICRNLMKVVGNCNGMFIPIDGVSPTPAPTPPPAPPPTLPPTTPQPTAPPTLPPSPPARAPEGDKPPASRRRGSRRRRRRSSSKQRRRGSKQRRRGSKRRRRGSSPTTPQPTTPPTLRRRRRGTSKNPKESPRQPHEDRIHTLFNKELKNLTKILMDMPL